MPRIRTVKPEYPQHRKVRSVSRDARLLNIHLWNLADDEGRLQELIPWILGAVFPGDEDVTPEVLRRWLGELQDSGLIGRYEVAGQSYIQCHDFNDHQSISKPRPSELPPGPAKPEPSPNAPGGLPEGSEWEGNGMEQGMEGKKAAATDPISQALDGVAFARNLPSPKPEAVAKVCADHADRDHDAEVANFAHYWIDGPGQSKPLSDVAWGWRRWLSRARPAEPTITRAVPSKPGELIPGDPYDDQVTVLPA